MPEYSAVSFNEYHIIQRHEVLTIYGLTLKVTASNQNQSTINSYLVSAGKASEILPTQRIRQSLVEPALILNSDAIEPAFAKSNQVPCHVAIEALRSVSLTPPTFSIRRL